MNSPLHADENLPNRADSLERNSSETSFSELMRLAKRGDRSAMGALIQDCREYLLLVANQDLDRDLQPKLGASDVVQETLMTALEAFGQFHGNDRSELLAWLRAILKNDLMGAHRHYKEVKKRHVDRESPLDSRRPDITDKAFTPSTRLAVDEESVMLENAMASLSAEHRLVLELRNWQELSFVEVGRQMDRSEDAARKLWARAVVQLRRSLSLPKSE